MADRSLSRKKNTTMKKHIKKKLSRTAVAMLCCLSVLTGLSLLKII